MSEKRSDEVYALGAFAGLHTVEGSYYLQVMIVFLFFSFFFFLVVLMEGELLDKTQDTQLNMNLKKTMDYFYYEYVLPWCLCVY